MGNKLKNIKKDENAKIIVTGDLNKMGMEQAKFLETLGL